MVAKGFLRTGNKEECLGCEACIQVCHKSAIHMIEDEEGFRYPSIETELCVSCGACNRVCPIENPPLKNQEKQLAFGGYHVDNEIKEDSTSGGAFSAIVEGWCDSNYVIFGAESDRLNVFHSYITDKKDLSKYRKSKYSQSLIGNSYKEVKTFLRQGKKVLFSGTPCHIAALKTFLKNVDTTNLLTVEVVCEGVPSPLYIRKFDKWIELKYGSNIKTLDYRYKDGRKWDFQVMNLILDNKRELKKDRWLNPFWSIWLQHLMSRPSCYHCPFTTSDRVADITLGDLWGVHLYCPELYGKNGGASLIVCNTEKGKQTLKNSRHLLYGHELVFSDALKYQSPMRKTINTNENRSNFMDDLKNLNVDYKTLVSKWAVKPSLQLLWQKYVWGNRQKVFLWNLKNNLKK